MIKRYSVFLFVVVVFSCCKKKEIGPQLLSQVVNTETFYDVLIGCEGNFGTANGSLSAYSSNSNELVNNFFYQINNFPLGDVVQAIELIDNDVFIVVNNSSKIERIDSATFLSVSTINGFNSPREIKKVADGLAYVTDLYSNSIQVVDLADNNIIDNIPVSAWTEGILVNNGFAYVSSPGANLIYKIDVTIHQLVDSISTGNSPSNIVLDKNNDLWVACSGSWGASNGTLERISLSSFSTDQVIQLNASVSELCINSELDFLYWLSDGVYKMDVDQFSYSKIIEENTGNFYGLGVHPDSEDVYVTDAVDYVQSGRVFKYSGDGFILDSLLVGIIPQAIFFK